MADTTTTTAKDTTTKKDTAAPAAAPGVTLSGSDPRSHPDLVAGESRLVASGEPVPGAPKAEYPDAVAERRAAGVPEPPKPGPGTDLYLTSGGYQVVPSGTTPEEMARLAREGTRQ
jgi:hypothetical protein